MRSLHSFLNESANTDRKKLIKAIEEVNKLISHKDKDGEPISVIDKTSSWEEPVIYDKITLDGDKVTIAYSYVYKTTKKTKEVEEYDLSDYFSDVENSEDYWKFTEVLDTIKAITKMHKNAIKELH